ILEILTSGKEADGDTSATELDPEWDPKWEHCETDRFQSIETDIVAAIIRRAKMKDLARNQGTILMNANKDKVVMNKGDAEDAPCKNCRKRKMSDNENSDTWTTKKSRINVQIYTTTNSPTATAFCTSFQGQCQAPFPSPKSTSR